MRWYEILWQLPQWIIGYLYFQIHFNDIIDVFIYEGASYYVTKEQKGSVTFCMDFIFLSEAAKDKISVIKHEYGHTVQSKWLGWLYLIIIGIPSILWAVSHRYIFKGKSYYSFPTESWANKLAGK